MTLLRAVICFIVVAISPFLLLQGLANARLSPGPVSWNGFWEADVARAFLQVEQTEDSLQLAVNDLGLELAAHAFVREPFATDALFLKAVDYRTQGQTDLVERIVDLGLNLDKRNRHLGVLELEEAALAGDFAQAFATIDRLTVTNPRLVRDFIQPLTAGLEQEDALPILREALDEEPRWAEAFWRSIPATPKGVSALYQLRRMTNSGVTAESDALLLAALVREEFYSDAFEFWESLGLAEEVGPTAFVPTTEFAPIGWRVTSAGGRSFSQLADGEFEVYIEQQTFGELARQLVRLQPGRYEFMAEVSPATVAQEIEASLECAIEGDGSNGPQQLVDTPNWEIDGTCDTYWLILTGSAWERRSSLQASISQMSFTRRP